MPARPEILQWLRQLAELDTKRCRLENKPAQFNELTAEINLVRKCLPTAILNHFDRRRSRNRPAIAAVRRGICGGCHILLSGGNLADLRREAGVVHICDNCGVFIYLEDTEPAAGEAPAKAPAPPPAKSRTKTPKKPA